MVKFASGIWQIHFDYGKTGDFKSAKKVDLKCKNITLDCTLEELAVLRIIANNSKITQKELASIVGKSERTIKTRTIALQEKGYMIKDGKRN